MEVVFQFELKKLSMLSRLSPEIGKATRGELEMGKAVYIARIDEIFAGHMMVEKWGRPLSTPRKARSWQSANVAASRSRKSRSRCATLMAWTACSRRIRAARFLRRFCRKGRKSNCLFDDRPAVGPTRRPNRFCRERRNRDRDTRVSPRSGEGQPTIDERQRRFRRPEIIAEMDCGMVDRGDSAAGSFGAITTPVFVGAGCRTQRGEH